MQNCTLIVVGRLSEDYFVKACKEYKKRLSAYCHFRVIEIAEEKLNEKQMSEANIQNALKKEAERMLNAANKKSELVALCVEGKQFSSEQLANVLQENAMRGQGDITFFIGSSHGLHATVKNAVNRKLSISPMTFPHQLCRLILTEQIYRGYTINSGKKYHK